MQISDDLRVEVNTELMDIRARQTLLLFCSFPNYGCTVMARKPRDISPGRSITSCVEESGAVDLQRACERVTPRSSGVEQTIRKVGRGVGEQTAVARCRGKTLRQLEEGKTAQRSIRFADRDPLLSIHSLLITFV